MSVICFEKEKFEKVGATLLRMTVVNDDRDMLIGLLPADMKFHDKYVMVQDREQMRRMIVDFVNDLHRSNTSAFNQQYGESAEIDSIEPKGYSYPSWVKLCRELHSIQYNIVENDGTAHNFRGAADKLERLLNGIHEHIVRRLPEYNREDETTVISLASMAAGLVPKESAKPEPEPKRLDIDRDQAIARIKAALKKRSGKAWSVTGGKGTGWGWITVCAMPKNCTWSYRLKADAVDNSPESWEGYDCGEGGHYMTPKDCAELGKLLGLENPCHMQGESIAASRDYYTEYVDRAEGRQPRVMGEQYWD